MKILKGQFLEGETVTVEIDGVQISRKVHYNRHSGLYIVYLKMAYFEYEFEREEA